MKTAAKTNKRCRCEKEKSSVTSTQDHRSPRTHCHVLLLFLWQWSDLFLLKYCKKNNLLLKLFKDVLFFFKVLLVWSLKISSKGVVLLFRREVHSDKLLKKSDLKSLPPAQHIHTSFHKLWNHMIKFIPCGSFSFCLVCSYSKLFHSNVHGFIYCMQVTLHLLLLYVRLVSKYEQCFLSFAKVVFLFLFLNTKFTFFRN